MRKQNLAKAERSGSTMADELKNPAKKNKEVELGEAIGKARNRTETIFRMARAHGARPEQVEAFNEVKETLKSERTEELTAQRLAEAITFVKNNTDPMGWADAADVLAVYPEALQWEQLNDQILDNLRSEVRVHGPVHLTKNREGKPSDSKLRVIDQMLQSEVVAGDVKKELSAWRNHIDGNRLYEDVVDKQKLFLRTRSNSTLISTDISDLLQGKFNPQQIEQAMSSRPQIPVVSAKDFGILVARLSREKNLSESDREQLRMQALGYAEAVLAARPVNPRYNSQEEDDSALSVTAAAQTLTELAGDERSVYELIDEKGYLAEQLARLKNMIPYGSLSVIERHHTMILNARREAQREKAAKEEAEIRKREEAEKAVKDAERIEKQRVAVNRLDTNPKITENLTIILEQTATSEARETAAQSLRQL